jgi:hypothetical protein
MNGEFLRQGWGDEDMPINSTIINHCGRPWKMIHKAQDMMLAARNPEAMRIYLRNSGDLEGGGAK